MRKNQMTILETELYERLSLISGHSKSAVRDVIKALSEFVIDEIRNGIPVVIGQLGTMDVKECKTRGYNFKTNEVLEQHNYNKVKFTPSDPLKRAARDTGED